MLVFVQQRGVEIRDPSIGVGGNLAGVVGDLVILVGRAAEEADAAGVVDNIGGVPEGAVLIGYVMDGVVRVGGILDAEGIVGIIAFQIPRPFAIGAAVLDGGLHVAVAAAVE